MADGHEIDEEVEHLSGLEIDEIDEEVEEVERLGGLEVDEFMRAVVSYVTGGSGRRIPRDVQTAALSSTTLAPRTLDALALAIRQAKVLYPRREEETKREYNTRIASFRAMVDAAAAPFQDVVDDLAHEEARYLAGLDDNAFERRWTAFILEDLTGAPVPTRVRALAFRSPRVAGRAEAICSLMVEDPARFLPPTEPGESRNAHTQRVTTFRRRVDSEARFLRYAIQYGEARHGRMPVEPNVRLRALRLLGDNHPEELSRLLHQVREDLREGKREARRDARSLRQAAGKGAP